MLKIKDDVDLIDLEKFGFEYHGNIDSCYYGCCEFYNNDISLFINNARIISLREVSGRTSFDLNVLYELIKNDLVEKVDDE